MKIIMAQKMYWCGSTLLDHKVCICLLATRFFCCRFQPYVNLVCPYLFPDVNLWSGLPHSIRQDLRVEMEENKGYSTVDACAVHCFTTATHTLSTVIRGQTMFIYIDNNFFLLAPCSSNTNWGIECQSKGRAIIWCNMYPIIMIMKIISWGSFS